MQETRLGTAKVVYTHDEIFFIVTEKNEVRWLERKWIQQEPIISGELRQSQKDKCCKCSLWVLDLEMT